MKTFVSFVLSAVFVVLSATAFAQDTTFTKEDANLDRVSVQLYIADNQGREQLILNCAKEYKDGDLTHLVMEGFLPADRTFTHEYGADGKIAEHHEFENDKATRDWVYLYNADGSWEMNGYFFDENGVRSKDPVYVEKWNKDDRIEKLEVKTEDFSMVRDFSYDGNGRLLKMEETPDGASKPISWEIYSYGDDGKLAKKETFSGGVLRQTVSYDGRGDQKEIVRYDGTGENAVAKSVSTMKYEVDAAGIDRKVEEISIGYSMKDGKWVQGATIKAKMKYIYNTK
ncbi:MAG: hypothetical protein Q8L24_00345 [bacterium]|nr:hypothetical protein [bacterium]